MYVCIHTYIYIYIRTHIYIYIYIHTYISLGLKRTLCDQTDPPKRVPSRPHEPASLPSGFVSSGFVAPPTLPSLRPHEPSALPLEAEFPQLLGPRRLVSRGRGARAHPPLGGAAGGRAPWAWRRRGRRRGSARGGPGPRSTRRSGRPPCARPPA
jgi:hypothetical protein